MKSCSIQTKMHESQICEAHIRKRRTDGRNCLLWLRYLSGFHRCNTKMKQREIQRLDDPSLHDQEGREPRCSSWYIGRATSILPSTPMLERGAQEELRFHSSSFSNVSNLSKLADEHRMDERVLQGLRRTCTRPLVRGHSARTRKIRIGVGEKFKQPRTCRINAVTS